MSADFEAEFSAHLVPGPDPLLPGAVLAYSNACGSKSYLKALGRLELGSSTPIAEDTVFWTASCAKLLTTIAVLQAIDLGYFSLDSADDVERILPELKDPDVLTGFTDDSPKANPVIRKAKSRITVRKLLTHTSGLIYDFIDPNLNRLHEVRGTTSAWLSGRIPEAFAPENIPLIYDPGEGWSYGPSSDWLGVMIERASPQKQRLGDFINEHICRPLGMTRTGFDLTPELRKNLMPMVTYSPSGELTTEGIHTKWPEAPRDHCGGAGLYTTTKDFIRVLAALLRNDGTLLPKDTVDAMFTPQISDNAALQATMESSFGQAVMMPTLPPDMQYTCGWGGCLTLGDVEDRLGKGTLLWVGVPNLSWYIDRKNGYCGFFGTQCMPASIEEKSRCTVLQEMFQKFARAECSKE